MNPDIYLCALLNQIVKAREGDVSQEFRTAAALVINHRGYDDKAALEVIKGALDLEGLLDQNQLVSQCKANLSEHQLREAVAMMAIVARIDGDISGAEEEVFSQICGDLGVQVIDGKVSFS